ncbi:sensor histidine kinase [Desulfuribacillus stibiiarsenatis]|nr:hypothetical protein [Desulfuribacillus stibiiarsenatis]
MIQLSPDTALWLFRVFRVGQLLLLPALAAILYTIIQNRFTTFILLISMACSLMVIVINFTSLGILQLNIVDDYYFPQYGTLATVYKVYVLFTLLFPLLVLRYVNLLHNINLRTFVKVTMIAMLTGSTITSLNVVGTHGLIPGVIGNYIMIISLISTLLYTYNITLNKHKRLIEKIIMDKSLNVFSSDLIHEIRNNATVVKGFNDIIMLENNDARTQKFTNQINTAIGNINLLITQYGEFIKHGTLKLESCDMTNIIQKVYTQFYYSDDIKININGNASVIANVTFLKQVLFNIIKNASEESRKLNIPCVINFDIDTDDNNADIKIIDSNGTLDYNFETDIFKIFESKKQDGFGIGLLACSKLMLYQDGKFNIINKSDDSEEKIIQLTLKRAI